MLDPVRQQLSTISGFETYHGSDDSESSRQQALILQLQRQSQQLMLVNQIYSEIRRSPSLNETFEAACRLLGQMLNCDRLRILATEQKNQDVLIVRAEYSQVNDAPQLGSAVRIADHAHLQELVESPGLASVVWAIEPLLNYIPCQCGADLETDCGGTYSIGQAIALYYQNQLHGIIELSYDRDCQIDRNRLPWSDWENNLIAEVAEHLAVAIDQFKCHEEVRHQARREALLRLMTNQIHQPLDLNLILQTAVREVRQLLDTDRVVIYQFGENWQGQVVVEETGEGWDSVLGDVSQDNCFSADYAHLYLGGRVRAIDNILEAGLDTCHVNFLQRLQVQANLIVPIVIGSKLWGLLLAHECRAPRAWQTWETELLQQLATQMAIAIQQAELFFQVRASAVQAQTQAEQLQLTLDELRNTQMQLVQSEKLSSLGQMVAGVAHEINNAINFVHANLPYAQAYAEALEQTVQIYEATYPEQLEAIAQINASLELDYVRNDFPKLLQSMKEGTKRVREIVLSLRNFSRIDEPERKPANLHQGLESTLLILQHRFKGGITLNKQYGNLPLVECHAGQINQVFLNILSNALDAAGEEAEITIQTWQSSPDWVTISIRDNGPGIPADVQERVFDPFFTTKAIGKGTGLGLSICYQIICKGHVGHIRCISEPGQGAEFRIELPVSGG